MVADDFKHILALILGHVDLDAGLVDVVLVLFPLAFVVGVQLAQHGHDDPGPAFLPVDLDPFRAGAGQVHLVVTLAGDDFEHGVFADFPVQASHQARRRQRIEGKPDRFDGGRLDLLTILTILGLGQGEVDVAILLEVEARVPLAILDARHHVRLHGFEAVGLHDGFAPITHLVEHVEFAPRAGSHFDGVHIALFTQDDFGVPHADSAPADLVVIRPQLRLKRGVDLEHGIGTAQAKAGHAAIVIGVTFRDHKSEGVGCRRIGELGGAEPFVGDLHAGAGGQRIGVGRPVKQAATRGQAAQEGRHQQGRFQVTHTYHVYPQHTIGTTGTSAGVATHSEAPPGPDSNAVPPGTGRKMRIPVHSGKP